MIKIRDATVHDAESGCAVVRRSISELCGPDHHDDPDILERWLRNSTVDSFRHLLSQGSKSIMVATEGDVVLALGLVADDGTIHLNYVSPDARFRGVSRALLHALEARAFERGNMSCKLLSTETARRFYLANAYKQTGPAIGLFGTSSGYPMIKTLESMQSVKAEADQNDPSI